MATNNPKNWNDTTPAAPAGKLNIKFQAVAPDPDPNVARNVSAYVEPATATTAGIVPTPPNDVTKFLRGDATFAAPPATCYIEIDADGSALTARQKLNFSAEFTAVDNAGAVRTDVSISAVATTKLTGTLAAAQFPALTGDVTSAGGTLSCTVAKIQGTGVKSGMSPAGNDVLTWVTANNQWENKSITSIPNANASQLQSVNVSTVAPTDRKLLVYSAVNADWEPGWDMNFYRYAVGATNSSGTAIVDIVPNGLGTPRWQHQAGTRAAIAPTATEMQLVSNSTSTASNNTTAFGPATNTNIPLTLGSLKRFRCRIGLLQTTTTRFYLGLSDQLNSANFATDTPPGNFVGFRFSTGASDTKYQCITQTAAGSSTKTAESTATHVDTGMHVFEFYWDGSNVIFLIDGVQVGSQSANAPATNVAMDIMIVINNVSTTNAVGYKLNMLQTIE